MSALLRLDRSAGLMALLVACATLAMAMQGAAQEQEGSGIAVAQRMTAGEVDLLSRQLAKCWNVPADTHGTKYPAVDIQATFNWDGSLARAEIVDAARMDADPLYRTVAQSAYRALQLCAPLQQMPADRYDSWKNVTLTFDPKEMIGQ